MINENQIVKNVVEFQFVYKKKKNSVNKVKEVRFVNMIKEDQRVKNV